MDSLTVTRLSLATPPRADVPAIRPLAEGSLFFIEPRYDPRFLRTLLAHRTGCPQVLLLEPTDGETGVYVFPTS